MNKELIQKQSTLIEELKTITTEGQNLNTLDIDLLDATGVLEKINEEDQKLSLIHI